MGILSKAGDARVRRLACRGLLVLAALLLPMATFVTTQPGGEAQVAGTDYLWAVQGGNYPHTGYFGACASPSSAESLATCFANPIASSIGRISAIATDGTNVYLASLNDGGLSCPVDQLGQNCSRIMTGPWSSDSGVETSAMVAADGQLWIGQGDGKIYRCPSDLPYAVQSTAPDECVLLDDSGGTSLWSLLLANGRLYVGLFNILWTCDPQAVNDCQTLDAYGSTAANSLVAGGGYLWAGLGNGILWRCDLNLANKCADWDTGGTEIRSISYDGQDTVYAALKQTYNHNTSVDRHGVIWSCPADSANSCSHVLDRLDGVSVAAGAGNVFSGTCNGIAFGTTYFSAIGDGLYCSKVLYIPAEGVQGVGGVDLSVRLEEWSHRIGRHCDAGGEGKKTARVTITNPNGGKKSVTTDLCDLRPGGSLKHTLDLLDPGKHKIKVRARGFIGRATVDVEANSTKPVIVRLKANR